MTNVIIYFYIVVKATKELPDQKLTGYIIPSA